MRLLAFAVSHYEYVCDRTREVSYTFQANPPDRNVSTFLDACVTDLV
jgi:hypothetical protein